jgi:restriction system protein
MFRRIDIPKLTCARSLFSYSGKDFEYICKYLLERMGSYQHVFVTHKGPKGGDDGIDLEMKSDGGVVIAYGQCKRWRRCPDGLIKIIREFAGAMMTHSARRGVLLVTVTANDYERREAAIRNIEIVDNPLFEKMIRSLNPTQSQMVKAKKRQAKN